MIHLTKLLRREEKKLLKLHKTVEHKLKILRSAISDLGHETGHGKRRVSAAARRKMSLAAKKRWAKVK